MRKALIALLLAAIVLAGCTQLPKTPEQRAMELADSLDEIKVATMLVDSMTSIDKCTVEKFEVAWKKVAEKFYSETYDPSMFEMTAEQRAQLEKAIGDSKETIKKCGLKLEKSAEKESENVYIVKYEMKTSGVPGCGTSGQTLNVKVDLEKETAELENQYTDMPDDYWQQMKEIVEIMGDCTGVMIYSMTSSLGTYSEATQV